MKDRHPDPRLRDERADHWLAWMIAAVITGGVLAGAYGWQVMHKQPATTADTCK